MSPADEAAVATHERIQRVALELFSTQGYDRTSMREIADRLGITKAALYYHYASKKDILAILVTPLIEDFERLVDGAAAPLSSPSDLPGLVEDYLDLLLRHRAVAALVARDLSSFAGSSLGERLRSNGERMARLLGGMEAPLEMRVRVAMALGALNGAILTFAGEPVDGLRGPVRDAALALLQTG